MLNDTDEMLHMAAVWVFAIYKKYPFRGFGGLKRVPEAGPFLVPVS